MSEEITLDDEYKDEVFIFLNDLRDSGDTNMFSAAPYIHNEFGFSLKECRAWLSKWMKEF